MAEHNILGVEAERKALTFLSEKSYQLLQKNYRFQKAEVDLIMQQGTTLICVEVKARTNDFFGTPEQFVSSKKSNSSFGLWIIISKKTLLKWRCVLM